MIEETNDYNFEKRCYLCLNGHEVQVGMYALLYAKFPMYKKKYVTFRTVKYQKTKERKKEMIICANSVPRATTTRQSSDIPNITNNTNIRQL